MEIKFRNLVYVADRGGTGQWRRIFAAQCINCISNSINTTVDFSEIPILDPRFYQGVSSVTVQRWISDEQREIFLNFLKPLSEQNSFQLIYEIDDCMSNKTIPIYNRGAIAYNNPKIQDNIKQMLNAADFVTVTTNRIKQYYHDMYDVPLENILAIPNTLPKWWFDNLFDSEKKLNSFNKNKKRPRIAIISSLSHYNIENIRQTKLNEPVQCITENETTKYKLLNGEEIDFSETFPVEDDITNIIPLIIETIKDVQWVFLGSCPNDLLPYVKSKDIEFYDCVPLLNYPGKLVSLNLQAIIAPLNKIEFNFCKSPIKFLESCALGVILYAQNCQPYSDCMDRKFLFDDINELKTLITKLKSMSSTVYKSIIENNYKWFHTPKPDGDFNLSSYWMEDNLGMWVNLFKLKQKPLSLSLDKFIELSIKENIKEEKDVIYETCDGVKILK